MRLCIGPQFGIPIHRRGVKSRVDRSVSANEGSRVQILENRRGYAKIRDDQGRDGWVRREILGRI